MRQGSDDIVAFNSKFSTIAYRANLDDDADIQYYMRAIKPALRSRILNMDTVPNTINKWQEKAALFDAHWRYNREIEKETTSRRTFTPRSIQSSRRPDPNAMQVDALSISQRDVYMKEGRCFGCGQTGHIQRACPLKGRKATTPNRNPFRTAAVGDTTKEAQVRALLETMTQEKRDEILKGFA